MTETSLSAGISPPIPKQSGMGGLLVHSEQVRMGYSGTSSDKNGDHSPSCCKTFSMPR